MELGGDDRNEGQEGETRKTQGTKEEHRKDNRKSKLLSKVIQKKKKKRRRSQKRQPGVWCPLDTKCLDADVSTGDVSHGFVSLS